MCPVPLTAIDPKQFRKTFSLETRKVRLTQVDLVKHDRQRPRGKLH